MMKLAILLVVGVIARQAYGDEPEAVVGGNNARPGDFPYQASLQQHGGHICGASIIDANHVLTAAHCITDDRSKWSTMTVVTGATSLKESGQVHKITCIQVHPEFNKPYWSNNDIAVITVADPIIQNMLQAPIPLASQDYGNGGYYSTLSGWGQLGAMSDTPDILQWIYLLVLNRSECMQKFPGVISENQICTYEKVGKGVCMGDSGGPLVINKQVAGIVSWGSPCAVGQPDVFTNVYQYLDFIKQCRTNSPTREQCPSDSQV